MSELETVKKIARELLTIRLPDGRVDSRLWERSQRVVCNIDLISQLPGSGELCAQIEEKSCLRAAGYFCDAGLAEYIRTGNRLSELKTGDVDKEELLDLCSRVVRENLNGVVEPSSIKSINRIIAESNNPLSKMAEAMILSDARSLDDMGAAGIFNELNHCLAAGKNLSDGVNSWDKKIDYGYWQNRLEKDFNFEQVRQAAKRRLDSVEEFMSQLKTELKGGDLKALVTRVVEQETIAEHGNT